MNNKIIGTALIVGGFLQMTRMIPIAVSDGIKMFENFPPNNVEDTIRAATASGWLVSHIMVFISSIFLISGFYGLSQKLKKNGQDKAVTFSFIGLSIGFIIYNIGAVIDGLFLPVVSHEFLDSIASEKKYWSVLIGYTHEFAISFGGLAFAHLLLSTGLLGIALYRIKEFKLFGIIGLVIGSVAFIGYITGILDLMVTGSFFLTGGLTMLMFIFFFALGTKLIRKLDSIS